MSRNFELLKNIGREEEFFKPEGVVREAARPERAPRPVPELTAQEMGPSFESPFEAKMTAATAMSGAAASAPAPSAEPLKFAMEGSQLAELAKVVQRVFLLPNGNPPRTVVFSSSEPGDGCSWICARVGELLASQVAGSVCLVDANLQSPTLHEQFSVPNHHGLSDALRHSGSIRGYVSQLSRRNLALLSCGSQAKESAGLVASDRMRARLQELREEFEYVLIDCSSISVSNEAISLGAASDGVVLVLKANSTRKDRARGAVQDLNNAKVRVLGAVLNQRTFPIPDSIYNKL
ncbi:MAG TPA: CpsD/CapB family tyrosine-protein kinase [Candidatus Sulfotelmatobacter sp.]